jgi:hypothetical protein
MEWDLALVLRDLLHVDVHAYMPVILLKFTV